MKKKALSPVITTILLILLAIVLASIILLWARGWVKETPLKFDSTLNEERPIQEICNKVLLQPIVSDQTVIVNNVGSIPVHKIELIVSYGGSSVRREYEVTLNAGDSVSIVSSIELTSDKKVEIVPVLLGKMKSGELSSYSCLNNVQLVE
jgi:flagellin-like protein